MSRIVLCEWLGGAEVRVFFADGVVVEQVLPGVRNAGRVRVVDGGLGLDPGDGGAEVGAWSIYDSRSGSRYDLAWEYPEDEA